MTKPPVTLAKLAGEIEHVETALGDILHKLDEINRCLSVVATKVGHLHDSNAREQQHSRRRRKTNGSRKKL